MFYLRSQIYLAEFLPLAVASFESISRVIWPWAISVRNPRGEGCPTGNQLSRYRDLDSPENQGEAMLDILATSEFSARIQLRRSFPSVWMEGVSRGSCIFLAIYRCVLVLGATASYKQQQSAQYRAVYTPVFPGHGITRVPVCTCTYVRICAYMRTGRSNALRSLGHVCLNAGISRGLHRGAWEGGGVPELIKVMQLGLSRNRVGSWRRGKEHWHRSGGKSEALTVRY